MRRLSRHLSSLLMGLTCLAFAPARHALALPQGVYFAHAQSTATLQGIVVDHDGAVVPGAKLAARHGATGVERDGKTSLRAAYAIMGSGMVGGRSVNYEDIGARAAE